MANTHTTPRTGFSGPIAADYWQRKPQPVRGAFTTMLATLDATWRTESRRCKVLAARYYIGAISLAELRACAQPVPVTASFTGPALLTANEVEGIVRAR